jgi:hypothetical protein
MGMTFYMRHSIDVFFRHRQLVSPLTQHIATVIDSVPLERCDIGLHLHETATPTSNLDLDVRENLCHLQPSSYHQPFLYGIMLMAKNYKLGYPELVSLLSAAEVTPNAPYYFVTACVTHVAANKQ